MEEVSSNLEQLKNCNSQGEEISQKESGVEFNNEVGSKLGKFKDVESLLNSYNQLQSDYTKKCQALATMEKEKLDKDNLAPQFDYAHWQEASKNFFDKNENAKQYEQDLIKIILSDNSVATSKEPLEQAWNIFLRQNFVSPEKLAQDEKFLQQHIFNNGEVVNKIVKDYFSSLSFNSSPTLISSQRGSKTMLSPVNKPKSIKEATKLVEEIFN